MLDCPSTTTAGDSDADLAAHPAPTPRRWTQRSGCRSCAPGCRRGRWPACRRRRAWQRRPRCRRAPPAPRLTEDNSPRLSIASDSHPLHAAETDRCVSEELVRWEVVSRAPRPLSTADSKESRWPQQTRCTRRTPFERRIPPSRVARTQARCRAPVEDSRDGDAADQGIYCRHGHGPNSSRRGTPTSSTPTA